MARHDTIDDVRKEIVERWQIPDWSKIYPWLHQPVTVKILFYADGPIQFDGGAFLGLKQVMATLTTDPYFWVQFSITTVHRAADPSADHSGLDLAQALALDAFDELWIYSFDAAPQLTAAELAAAKTFMDDHKGGVLITGDHADLGAAFGNLPRAGKMRQLPAPDAAPPNWNDTLRPGPTAGFQFEDQSDATPQPLELTWYWGGVLWKRPHQVLCSPLGPIDIFPDHQHEGEALAPAPNPASEWPGGVAAEVIARGTIIDPGANVGRKIGVLSAYEGHSASVGRILADSTWHHHFDINLRGLPGDPTRTGFVVPGTSTWLSSATKIEHYFVNAGVWLAPPGKQAAMRLAAWWGVLWDAHLIQLDPGLHPRLLGKAAYDALGRYAPQCTVFHWIWDLVPVSVQERYARLALTLPDPPPFFEYVAGTAASQLMAAFHGNANRRLPETPPDLDRVGTVLDGVAERALDSLTADLEERMRLVRGLTG
ncbi:MAG TPA: hypothetical protein VLJ59_17200 [Mycobacteriales bacterium]|nr:hypothetical protein [Mycobacteriales bacterium]